MARGIRALLIAFAVIGGIHPFPPPSPCLDRCCKKECERNATECEICRRANEEPCKQLRCDYER